MKYIPKKLLDECIEATRAYWECPASETEERYEVKSEKNYALMDSIGVDWLSVQDFLDGILNSMGFCPDAENDEIYCALRCIGWMPVDE